MRTCIGIHPDNGLLRRKCTGSSGWVQVSESSSSSEHCTSACSRCPVGWRAALGLLWWQLFLGSGWSKGQACENVAWCGVVLGSETKVGQRCLQMGCPPGCHLRCLGWAWEVGGLVCLELGHERHNVGESGVVVGLCHLWWVWSVHPGVLWMVEGYGPFVVPVELESVVVGGPE